MGQIKRSFGACATLQSEDRVTKKERKGGLGGKQTNGGKVAFAFWGIKKKDIASTEKRGEFQQDIRNKCWDGSFAFMDT